MEGLLASEAGRVLALTVIAAVSTVVGGSLPLIRGELSQRAESWVIALAAGILLSVSLNEMIPESFEAAGEAALLGASAGFIVLYILERITTIHACRDEHCDIHAIFGLTALVGIGVHSLFDGFAIAVGFEFSPVLGLSIAGAVLVHRFPDGISVAAVALSNRYPRPRIWLLLAAIGALAILGAVVGLGMGTASTVVLGAALGISAGTFLYIATADLLPIAHRNYRDLGVPVAFLLGFVGIYFLLRLVEG